jgi:Na+-transporting NADH:ubiquinone oxidoreductase subunit A
VLENASQYVDVRNARPLASIENRPMRIRLKRGLDIAVGGTPEQRMAGKFDAPRVAVAPGDFQGVRPVLSVEPGDRVFAGQALFHDRHARSVVVTAPVSGTVSDIRRGSKRRVLAITIDRSGDDALSFPVYDAAAIGRQPVEELRGILLRSGAWSGLRARPFDRVASPAVEPRALFVTAIDTHPLAPDPSVAIRAAGEAFDAGILALARLTRGTTFVCVAADAGIPVPEGERIQQLEIRGPHPAGLPGTHLHAVGLAVRREPDLWHIGYQDVIAIGRLLLSGRIDARRVIAVGGPGAREPRLIQTLAGADLVALAEREALPGCHAVSGSPLQSDTAARFLGRYHNQVTLLREAVPAPAGSGAMLPLESIERVWPFRLSPLPLLRALLAGDTEGAEFLGCLGLAEEDLALCSHACSGRNDYGSALRRTLDALERDA